VRARPAGARVCVCVGCDSLTSRGARPCARVWPSGSEGPLAIVALHEGLYVLARSPFDEETPLGKLIVKSEANMSLAKCNLHLVASEGPRGFPGVVISPAAAGLMNVTAVLESAYERTAKDAYDAVIANEWTGLSVLCLMTHNSAFHDHHDSHEGPGLLYSPKQCKEPAQPALQQMATLLLSGTAN
jgi:hypothetical protein